MSHEPDTANRWSRRFDPAHGHPQSEGQVSGSAGFLATTAQVGAVKAVAKRLGMHAETLRSWVRQHQVDDGQREGVSTEIRALKRRNAELEQTAEVLKAATSFLVRESDPRTPRR